MSAVAIRSIQIENFRSIKNILLDVTNLTVLVGQNDSGKSNTLRALNLFFNGETDSNQPFDFVKDNHVLNKPNKKTPSIKIKLTLNIPNRYKSTNGDYVEWEKVWFKGETTPQSNYHGVRIKKGKRGRNIREIIEIPGKSNLHSLLRKIEYRYIPAVKDERYFDVLRSEIYKTISFVANDSFKKSSNEFGEVISTHVKTLTQSIANVLGFSNKMALPYDLSHVFAKLEFISSEHEISLNARGDGIKARHIPLILKYIAEQKKKIQSRGSMPISFIWGYEEPENNLEYFNSLKLADEFLSLVINDEIDQIFLTTHSPAFYNLQLKNQEPEILVSCHNIYMESMNAGTKVNKETDFNEKMGVMALFAPFAEDLRKTIENQKNTITEIEHLNNLNASKKIIFVEGLSDKLFLEKLFKVFAPKHSESLIFETKEFGAGHGYVFDMMSAWHSKKKHHPEMSKVVGIVDADSGGQSATSKWKELKASDSGKIFKYPMVPHIKEINDLGYSTLVPVLEMLYPLKYWLTADNDKMLEEDDGKNFSLSVISTDEFHNFCQENQAIYLKKRVKISSKCNLAKKISNLDDEVFKKDFDILNQRLVKDIIGYLFPHEGIDAINEVH